MAVLVERGPGTATGSPPGLTHCRVDGFGMCGAQTGINNMSRNCCRWCCSHWVNVRDVLNVNALGLVRGLKVVIVKVIS
jgi:hypothetical protein